MGQAELVSPAQPAGSWDMSSPPLRQSGVGPQPGMLKDQMPPQPRPWQSRASSIEGVTGSLPLEVGQRPAWGPAEPLDTSGDQAPWLVRAPTASGTRLLWPVRSPQCLWDQALVAD